MSCEKYQHFMLIKMRVYLERRMRRMSRVPLKVVEGGVSGGKLVHLQMPLI